MLLDTQRADGTAWFMDLSEDKYDWSGVLETLSGTAFDVYMPTVDMVEFRDIAHPLSLICRYNGHIPNFYSVAEHSVRVSWKIRELGGSLMDQMCGLMHDSAEAYVGDMIRPIKRHGELGYYHSNLELGVMQVISDKFGFTFPFPEIVHKADKDLYYWEVKNIRTGKRIGWEPNIALEAFITRYKVIKQDLVGGIQ